MLVHQLADPIFNWDNVGDYLRKSYPHYPAITPLLQEHAQAQAVDWVLFAIFGLIRSEGFTSELYKKNLDIFALGETFTTFRNAIKAGALEFAKFTNSNEFADEAQVAEEYKGIYKHCVGTPPQEPPLPTPKPDVPPEYPTPPEPVPDFPKTDPKPPKEEPTPAPQPTSTWKYWAKKACELFLVVIGVVGLGLPSWVTGLIKIAINAIIQFLGA